MIVVILKGRVQYSNNNKNKNKNESKKRNMFKVEQGTVR